MESKCYEPGTTGNEMKSKVSQRFDFSDLLAITALIVTLIVPAFSYSYRTSVELSILQGCWNINSESLTVICVGLLLLPIIFLVVHHVSSIKAQAFWLLAVAGVISIAVYWGILGEIPGHFDPLSGAFPIYSTVCFGGVFVSIIKDSRWQRAITAATLCMTAFICYYSLPFLGTNECFYLTGSQTLKASADSNDIWPKMFCYCPLIATILAIVIRSRKGTIICAAILLLPWISFTIGAPENWEFMRAMGFYLLCVAGVAVTTICKSSDKEICEDSKLSAPSEGAVESTGSFMSRYTNIGIITITVAVLTSIRCIASPAAPYIVPLFCIACYCSIIYIFRSSVSRLTLFALAGLILSYTINLVLFGIQQNHIVNNEFDALESMNNKFILNWILLIISIIGVVANHQNLKRYALLTYLAIPIILLFCDGWIFIHVLGIAEVTDSYLSTLNTVWIVECILLSAVALALICLNRAKKEEQ